jgi:UDP-glucose 4-epimerase
MSVYQGKIGPGTIAVTGASGFIGRYLCADLAAQGYEVLPLGRAQTDYSRASLTNLLAGALSVVHLAGRRMTRADASMDIGPFWQPNVTVIGDLVAAAQASGVKKIILASTIAAYSPASGLPWVETAPMRPVNAYALSKVMAEAYLEMLTRQDGPAGLALRFAAVYGHGEKNTPALMHFVEQASAAQELVLTGHPDARIDQIYVRDATAAIIAALRHPTATGVFNIGGGRAIPVAEIAQTVTEVFGTPGHLRHAGTAIGAMPHAVMDLGHTKAALGWEPVHSVRRGLEDFRKTRDLIH